MPEWGGGFHGWDGTGRTVKYAKIIMRKVQPNRQDCTASQWIAECSCKCVRLFVRLFVCLFVCLFAAPDKPEWWDEVCLFARPPVLHSFVGRLLKGGDFKNLKLIWFAWNFIGFSRFIYLTL